MLDKGEITTQLTLHYTEVAIERCLILLMQMVDSRLIVNNNLSPSPCIPQTNYQLHTTKDEYFLFWAPQTHIGIARGLVMTTTT